MAPPNLHPIRGIVSRGSGQTPGFENSSKRAEAKGLGEKRVRARPTFNNGVASLQAFDLPTYMGGAAQSPPRRPVALAANFQTHGTIGLILRSHRRGQVSKTETFQLLRDLPVRTTLCIHKDFLAVIVAMAETEAI
jgi:hypothetical protein